MNDFTKLLLASSVSAVFALGLSGCGESPASDEQAHSAEDGHDHSKDSKEDHDHPTDDHDDHGEARSLGDVVIANTKLSVSIGGDLDPGAEVNIDLEHTGGPAPAAVRLWIGDEAGTGALKTKADGHDDHFHGHADVPESLAGAALWIEIEAVDGSRTAASVPLD